MYEILFSYPVNQDETFGSSAVPAPKGLRLEVPEKVLGFDGTFFMLVNIVTSVALNIVAAYLYERFFKPQKLTKELPKAVNGERIFWIGSEDDVMRMIEELRKPRGE